jgi:hypothetical protein
MSSIKQLIVNAILKVSEANPAYDREGGPTHQEARDEFIRALLAELFPEDPSMPATVQDVVVPVSETVKPEPEAGKKKRAPMSEEAKAAAKAKREAKKAQDVSPPVLETAGSNAAAGAGGSAEPAAEPAKEKKPRKPKADKPAEGANLAKIDPTWRKHLKNADKEHAKELEPELLKYLNGLSKEEFDAKKAEEHVAEFVASRAAKPAEDDGKVAAELVEIEFNGKTYSINPETKRVYEGEGEYDDETGWTNYKPVGYVGMAAFAEMKLEE